MLKIRLAVHTDIEMLLQLEAKGLQDELNSNEQLLKGQAFSRHDFEELIHSNWVIVATKNEQIIAYAMFASWAFFNSSHIHQKMYRQINQLGFNDKNSCQYGPVWIEKKYRGSGIFQKLMTFLCQQIAHQFSYLITFIAEQNEVSFAAHTKNGKMQVIDYFEFENRDYYILERASAE